MAKIPIEIEVIDDKAIQSTDAFGGSLGGVISGIKAMTIAARAFIATPLGAILAGVALALGALTSFFKRSEEGQNKLNKVVRIFSSILDNVLDVVDQVGEAIFDAISNPKQLVIDLGNLIKENLINRFKAFAVIGKAIAKIFSGEFKEGFKDLADGAIQLTTGIEDFTDKAVEAFDTVIEKAKAFAKEVEEDIKVAKALADIEAQLNRDERAFTIARAKREAQIAELRLKAREDARFDAAERKAFLEEASDLINKQLDEELAIAKLRLFVLRENNKLANSTIETKQEEAELEAKLSELQAKRFTEQRALQREFLRINNEIRREQELQQKEEARRSDERNKQVVLDIRKIIDINKKRSAEEQRQFEERQRREAAERDGRLATVSAVADATALGAKLFGEQTVAGIALGVATATADTFVAANKALATIPPPANFVVAGVIIAAGLANVAQIIKAGQSVGASVGGGGAAASTTSATSATNFSTVSAGIAQQQGQIVVNPKVSVEEINSVQGVVTAKEIQTTI